MAALSIPAPSSSPVTTIYQVRGYGKIGSDVRPAWSFQVKHVDIVAFVKGNRVHLSAKSAVQPTLLSRIQKGALMGAGAVQHSFSGHETFPFRYPWLKKGYD